MQKQFGTALVMALALAVGGAYGQDQPQGQGITVTVNGRQLNFPGTGPQMVNGRVLVPLRGIFERLGATVQWNPDRHEVIATRGRNNVELQIGDANATVDDRQVTLDVPAQIVDGATMVPIRFVSESLGAQVRWHEAEQTVVIDSGRGRAQEIISPPATIVQPQPEHRRPPAEIFELNSVLPVTLDDTLSSDGSHRGDQFMATVRTAAGNMYGYLPAGTRVTGIVTEASPRQGGEPGLLEVEFTQVNLPDGTTYPIAGRLIDINAPGLARNNNGILIARGEAVRINRPAWAGIGANGRVVVNFGGSYTRTEPRDVTIRPGTEFGVRLTRALTIRGRDLGH